MKESLKLLGFIYIQEDHRHQTLEMCRDIYLFSSNRPEFMPMTHSYRFNLYAKWWVTMDSPDNISKYHNTWISASRQRLGKFVKMFYPEDADKYKYPELRP
jgi:hypothetical protein